MALMAPLLLTLSKAACRLFHTGLYDRRNDAVELHEVERVVY
jgi:hypothetical protein